MKSKGMMLYIALSAVIVVGYLLYSRTPDDSMPVQAPDIALPLHKRAAPIHLQDLKGQVVLLDFWATWCGPCKMSMPVIEQVYEKYRDKGLTVVGIATDGEDTRKDIPRLTHDLGITYPIVLGSDIYDLRAKYTWTAIPVLFVIDKQGKIRDRQNGYDPDYNLEEAVVRLLKEK